MEHAGPGARRQRHAARLRVSWRRADRLRPRAVLLRDARLRHAGVPGKATTFSLVSRLLAALALLVLALSPRRKLRYPAARDAYLLGTLALVALVYWAVLYHPEVLPRTYAPGTGLTAFKVGAEYVLAALHVVAAVGFYRQLGTAQSRNAGYLFAASVIMALSQSLNALYSHPCLCATCLENNLLD
jgi:hypothetical protein